MKFFRFILIPISITYGVIMFLRNKLYDIGLLNTTKYNIPIISVGNLSVGGSGKTPMIEYLISLLSEKYKIAVLSRGYKRKTKGFLFVESSQLYTECGDEPFQIKRKFPEIIVAVDENRVNGANILLNNQNKPEIILLDDAFQHRRITPGLSLLLTDYYNLYINDYVLPTGRLREFFSGAKRANAIIVTKCPPVISPITKRLLINELNINSKQKLFFSYIDYSEPIPVTFSAKEIVIKKFNTIMLISGISNPYPLEQHLKKYCHELINIEYHDHHQYSYNDWSNIIQHFKSIISSNKAIFTTEKDAVKLFHPNIMKLINNYPIYYVPIKTAFFKEDEKSFNKYIFDYVRNN